MNRKTTNRIAGLFALLAVATFAALLTLKLCGVLPWSWWWISAPVWMAACLAVGVTGMFTLVVIAFVWQTKPGKKGGIR